jgi:hypothetical protein
MADRPERDKLAERVRELEAEAAELRAENVRLHEQLTTLDQINVDLTKWANHGWARVSTLSKRTQRLLRLARYFRNPGRKPTLPDHEKAIMMVRYIELGGLDRGHGKGARATLMREFHVSPRTVDRVIREFKLRTVTKFEAMELVRRYRRRYGG